ncbi:MAG: TTAGGG repeat binding factor [Peltula sp. TS41687]|nr:MAG: TTAGGG repeat binding factor [Peltula sp. TS41687]
MDELRSPPRKRRRIRASTSTEEAPRKRLRLDLEPEEVAITSETAQDQATEANLSLFEKPAATQQGSVASPKEPKRDPSSMDQFAMNSHGHNLVEQNPWAVVNPQHSNPTLQMDTSSTAAAINYAYMMAITGANPADPGMHMRVQSLPVLENLAVQLLQILAKGSYQETLTMIMDPEHATGRAYSGLKSLFEHTKTLYCADEPFLLATDLNLHTPEYSNIIRKANLATFISSVFGSQDVGFYHLNEYFLETFVPSSGRLLKSQGALYLDLKTQAYISAMTNGERSRDEILEDLFPPDLEARLMSRRPGAKQMTPSEVDFVKRARSRRDHLLCEPDNQDAIAALPDRYAWEDFLRDIVSYLSKNLEDLVGGPAPKPHRGRISTFPMGNPAPPLVEQPMMVNTERMELDTEDPHMESVLQAYTRTLDEQRIASQNLAEQASQAVQVMTRRETAFEPPAQGHPVDETSVPASETPMPQEDVDKSLIAQSYGGLPEIPYHTQSAPTQVLYERARLAATAKASPNNRRAGLPSQRRPWTTEEENALMAGLDRVKGPHWSQILAMFGAGGTINESLKDRNQVQLKDKARNLKLFFLKSGIEVPYYLQFVTGELKTRAPGQAAKNEAKAEAKMRGDEDRAHVEGVLALAGGARLNGEAGHEVPQNPGVGLELPTAAENDYEQQVAAQLQAATEPQGPQHVPPETSAAISEENGMAVDEQSHDSIGVIEAPPVGVSA